MKLMSLALIGTTIFSLQSLAETTSKNDSYIHQTAVEIYQNDQCVKWAQFHQRYADRIEKIYIDYSTPFAASRKGEDHVLLQYCFQDGSIIEITLNDLGLKQLDLTTQDLAKEEKTSARLGTPSYIKPQALSKLFEAQALQELWLDYQLDKSIELGDNEVIYHDYLSSTNGEQKERQELCGTRWGQVIRAIRKLLLRQKNLEEVSSENISDQSRNSTAKQSDSSNFNEIDTQSVITH